MDPRKRAPEGRPTGAETQTGLSSSTRLTQRALEGDPVALAEFQNRHKERLRRIVSIRLAARLARVLEEELPDESVRGALLGRREADLATEADLVRFLAQLVEREVRRRSDRPAQGPHAHPRTLRFDDPDTHDPSRARREGQERILDARVAALEPRECREVLLLRDYCGAEWDLVRAHLGLLSIEAAQALYRRAHEALARRMRLTHGR